MNSTNLAGGAYTAYANKDGSFDILDVPIMAEVPKGDKGAPEDIGHRWLQSAVDKAQERFHTGYLAPLHVRHHEIGAQTIPAGFVLPKRVERRMYDGRPVWTVIADLKRLPPHIFAKVHNLEIPYRSVEIGRWDRPEIQSLALLEDDAPYFKFELLTVGQIVPADASPSPEPSVFADQSAPRRAVMVAQERALVLFSFRDGGKMAYDEPKKEDKAPDAATAVAEPPKPAPGKTEISEPGKDAENTKAGDPMAKLAEAMAAFGTKLDAILKMMTGGAEAMAAQDANITPTEQPAPAPEAKAPEAKEPEKAKMSDDAAALLKENATLEARLAALEAKTAESEKRAKLKETADGALEELKEWPLTDDTKAKIRKLAEKDASGEALKAFVETYKAGVPKDPPPTLSEMDGGRPDPDEVLAYAAKGPEALEAARAASKMFDECVAHRLTEKSRGEFMEIQLSGRYAANGR